MTTVKRYSASELRQSLARALDEVERGHAIVVERRGRRFRIVPERSAKPAGRTQPIFRVSDPELLETGWTWSWTGNRLALRVEKRKRPRR